MKNRRSAPVGALFACLTRRQRAIGDPAIYRRLPVSTSTLPIVMAATIVATTHHIGLVAPVESPLVPVAGRLVVGVPATVVPPAAGVDVAAAVVDAAVGVPALVVGVVAAAVGVVSPPSVDGVLLAARVNAKSAITTAGTATRLARYVQSWTGLLPPPGRTWMDTYRGTASRRRSQYDLSPMKVTCRDLKPSQQPRSTGL